MASRGGRGGGRGGRGGASGKPQPPIGHLNFADIIAHSKEGTDVLYPPMELPDTDVPSTREARIARRYNNMVAEMKFTPFWIDAPTKASTEIERFSDRFKQKTASVATATIELQNVHQARQYDKDLLPPSVFEAVFEKKRKAKAGADGRRKRTVKSGLLEGDDDQPLDVDGSDAEDEEDPDLLEDEDEDEEGDNDYEAEYFDNGEDDDNDALGGGGGGDDDGGIMD
ncbi:hypothetical protein JCM1840_005810 [Sporobolomyces johnsonii]